MLITEKIRASRTAMEFMMKNQQWQISLTSSDVSCIIYFHFCNKYIAGRIAECLTTLALPAADGVLGALVGALVLSLCAAVLDFALS